MPWYTPKSSYLSYVCVDSSGLYVRASQYLFCLYSDIHLNLLLLMLYAEVDCRWIRPQQLTYWLFPFLLTFQHVCWKTLSFIFIESPYSRLLCIKWVYLCLIWLLCWTWSFQDPTVLLLTHFHPHGATCCPRPIILTIIKT